jgi:hypothetical protein
MVILLVFILLVAIGVYIFNIFYWWLLMFILLVSIYSIYFIGGY